MLLLKKKTWSFYLCSTILWLCCVLIEHIFCVVSPSISDSVKPRIHSFSPLINFKLTNSGLAFQEQWYNFGLHSLLHGCQENSIHMLWTQTNSTEAWKLQESIFTPGHACSALLTCHCWSVGIIDFKALSVLLHNVFCSSPPNTHHPSLCHKEHWTCDGSQQLFCTDNLPFPL